MSYYAGIPRSGCNCGAWDSRHEPHCTGTDWPQSQRDEDRAWELSERERAADEAADADYDRWVDERMGL